MPDIAIITDSVACLTSELISRYQIQIIPFTLLSSGKVYRDGVDMTPSQAYEMFLKEPDTFKTAPFSPEDCLSMFRRLSQRFKNLLFTTVSVKISTAFNIARIARDRALAELPGTKIEILDSATAASAEGFVVLAAARAAAAGKSFSEVLAEANRVKERVHAIVLLDTVKYVYRSGRVPRIAAQAASVLNIRPIFNLYGQVNFVTAARSRRNGIDRMLQIMREKIDAQPIHCAIMHAYDPVAAAALQDEVRFRFNTVELWISEFSPIMGYATGTGTLGLAFYAEEG